MQAEIVDSLGVWIGELVTVITDRKANPQGAIIKVECDGEFFIVKIDRDGFRNGRDDYVSYATADCGGQMYVVVDPRVQAPQFAANAGWVSEENSDKRGMLYAPRKRAIPEYRRLITHSVFEGVSCYQYENFPSGTDFLCVPVEPIANLLHKYIPPFSLI